MKYLKLLNDNSIHFGFKYNEGLNIDTNDFNGHYGLYFSDNEILYQYYVYGNNICAVTLPTNDPDFKFHEYAKGTYKANKIILGPKENLLDPEIVIKYDLKITNHFIHEICK